MTLRGIGLETRCSSRSNGALPTQWDTIPWAFTGRPVGAGVLVRCLRRVLSFLFKLTPGAVSRQPSSLPLIPEWHDSPVLGGVTGDAVPQQYGMGRLMLEGTIVPSTIWQHGDDDHHRPQSSGEDRKSA